uniref:hybrid sensor histidine kinase/response regulator n=1 Tax=Sphingomonas bacterium TaxID=1895847 RepID=UPI0026276218|nr:PAS domain-containing protein [Sphingomonas bacterium]
MLRILRKVSTVNPNLPSGFLPRTGTAATLNAARLALVAACGLALAGSVFGLLFAVPSGAITGFGIWLVASCVVFSACLLVLLAIRPIDQLGPIAITATAYFGAYLIASAVHAIFNPHNSSTLFAALFWLIPLQTFNNIVNRGRKARILAWILLVAPLLTLGLLWPRILQIFPPSLAAVLIIFCLAHLATALMVNILLRYREAYFSEQEHSASLRFASQILESITDAFFTLDREWRFTFLNSAVERQMGQARSDLIGKVIWDEFPALADGLFRREFERVTRDDCKVSFEHLYARTGALLSLNVYPSAEGVAVYFQDITEQRATEQALRAGEKRLSELAEFLEKANDAIMARDIDGRVTFWNASAARLFGLPSGEVLGRPVHEVLGIDLALSEDATARVLRDGEWRRVINLPAMDGRPLVIDSHLTVIRDDAGEPKSILTINTDITAQTAIEERLLRTERLESLGQLTGGVAHDFNNLLTVITLNAEVILLTPTAPDGLRDLAEMIKQAARRGAALTQRLLAFARQQTLEPVPTDVHALLADTEPLLRQALREDITLALLEETGIWDALVDPNQLENALLNLCVNAKDAMPDGGMLTIEATNATLDRDYADRHSEVTPGDYVAITVTDSGTGIAPENLGKVFDPFFTTKEFGTGTGLGLSMVYGFVKQSRGHISIYSEPGHGTNVKLFLPRATDAPEAGEDEVILLEDMRGTETILVVEDDDFLRGSVARQLTGLGYRVITSASGQEALDLIGAGIRIDLLFTDVIMPGGLNGPALAEAARAAIPALRVLYTSGYTEKVIAHRAKLDGDIQLLSKPYALADLALKVRTVLAGPA